jgi:serine/threonine-protein kinase
MGGSDWPDPPGIPYHHRMVTPGQILAGKFQVERVLGQGGMGVVVSAYHMVLGQRVALKFLLPEAMQHREAVERFLREARAAVRLKSEHVGRVIDVGTLEDGAPYIVMEYLDGMDLSGYMQRHGTLPVLQAVDFLLQGLEAIAEAHAIGIVHRDLKPANLFITRAPDGGPLIKVLDFGISKAATADQDFSLTRTSAVMGSPGYMSPEQLRSTRDVDARSDIWSLGVILYELTTGRQPFVAESITELALKVAMDPAPPLYLPSAHGFEQVVARCLEKDAGKRFANVAELAAALVPFGPATAAESAARIARVLQVQITNPFARPATGQSIGTAPTTLSGATGQATHGGGKKSRTGLVAAIGAVLVAGGVGAVIALGGGKASTGPAAAGGSGSVTAPAGSGSVTAPAGSAAVVTPAGSAAATAPAGSAAGTAPAGSATVTPPAGSDAGSAAIAAPPAGSDAGSAVIAAPTGGSAAPTGAGSGSKIAKGAPHGAGRRGSGHGSGHGQGSGTGSSAGSNAGSDDFSNSRY